MKRDEKGNVVLNETLINGTIDFVRCELLNLVSSRHQSRVIDKIGLFNTPKENQYWLLKGVWNCESNALRHVIQHVTPSRKIWRDKII